MKPTENVQPKVDLAELDQAKMEQILKNREEEKKKKKKEIHTKLRSIFDKTKNTDGAYQIFWSKKFQTNYYDGLINNEISKVAERIAEDEEKQKSKDQSLLYIMDDHQREKYLRRKMYRQQQNARLRTLAELRIFKRNYKKLVEKIGASTAVSKNREKIKHNVVGGCIDIENKQNKKIFESILDEAKILKEKIKKYKEMPTKYDKVKSKYLEPKKNAENSSDPLNLFLKGQQHNDEDDPLPYPLNKMKEHFEERQKNFLMNKRMTLDHGQHRNLEEKVTNATSR